MKTLILFVTLIVSQILFAGTGGGGVMMMSSIKDSASEIVYHMGEQDGVVRFAYGQLVQGQWQVQNAQVSTEELASSPEYSKQYRFRYRSILTNIVMSPINIVP